MFEPGFEYRSMLGCFFNSQISLWLELRSGSRPSRQPRDQGQTACSLQQFVFLTFLQVFQAAALVVADRSITTGIDFWSVSVTAERLIRMLQVPPHLLAAWLASRRAEGYTCVGCEQTVGCLSASSGSRLA